MLVEVTISSQDRLEHCFAAVYVEHANSSMWNVMYKAVNVTAIPNQHLNYPLWLQE